MRAHLGAKTPNFPQADLLIEGDTVAEVGPGLRARDAELIDAADTVVMPGSVDAHRHVWRSLFRNLGATPAPAGRRIEPEDVYAGTLVGLLGAAEAGVTTVVDRWSFEPSDVDAAEAALRAHADAGLRTVFVPAVAPGADGPAIRDLFGRLSATAGPSTTIAFGSVAPAPDELDAIERQWTLARELGLRIHAHAGAEDPGPGAIAAAARRGLLGDDVTLVHLAALDRTDAEAVAAAGASVALARSSERGDREGWPPIQVLVEHAIRPGLGVEDDLASPGDVFARMRETISLQHAKVFDLKLAGRAGVPRLLSTRDVIRYATIDGARAAGLAGVVGTLEPGMQADVIVLRTDRPNVFPINDPIGAVVWGMDTSNVELVLVGGRPVMRSGALDADLPRARALAEAARERVGAGAEPDR